nr:hypothetical protein [Tanacetum cinerariifolium]
MYLRTVAHRVRDSDYLADVEVDSRDSSEPSRSRGIDMRVLAETVARDEIGMDTGDIVEGGESFLSVKVCSGGYSGGESSRGYVIEDVQREQGCRIVGVVSVVSALNERIAELERDNRRLRGTASVEGQRVDR